MKKITENYIRKIINEVLSEYEIVNDEYIDSVKDLFKPPSMEEDSNFDKTIKDAETDVQQKSQNYAKPMNQLRTDLVYAIKWNLDDYLPDFQEKYDDFKEHFSADIKGLMYKFSGGKFELFEKSDTDKIKSIIENQVYMIFGRNYKFNPNTHIADIKKAIMNILNELKKSNFLKEDTDKDWNPFKSFNEATENSNISDVMYSEVNILQLKKSVEETIELFHPAIWYLEDGSKEQEMFMSANNKLNDFYHKYLKKYTKK